jgi:hypothetical protein
LLSSLLGKPFGELLVGGWQQSRKLMDAAQRSLQHPGVPELVSLDPHSVTVRQGPKIEVVIDGRPVTTIDIKLVITFTLSALDARIRDGAIVAFDSGRVVIESSLAVQGVDVAHGRVELDAHAVVPLGAGVVLVRAQPMINQPTINLQRDGRVSRRLRR